MVHHVTTPTRTTFTKGKQSIMMTPNHENILINSQPGIGE